MNTAGQPPTKRLAFFEPYLTVWVFLCMIASVLAEVPVMLSVCHVCNRSHDWYQAAIPELPTTS